MNEEYEKNFEEETVDTVDDGMGKLALVAGAGVLAGVIITKVTKPAVDWIKEHNPFKKKEAVAVLKEDGTAEFMDDDNQ